MSLLLTEVFWELVAIVDEVWVFWERSACFIEGIVHYSNGFLVCYLELRIKHVDDTLDCLVRYQRFKRSSTEMSLAFWAAFTIRIRTEIFEDAGLAESVQALVDRVGISVKPSAE